MCIRDSDMILFFTNKGKLYKLRGYEIPEAGRTAKGTAIVNLLMLYLLNTQPLKLLLILELML